MRFRNLFKNKIILIALGAFILLGSAFFAHAEMLKKEDSFWKNFLTYFQRSQPEQKITDQIYQKPFEGASVAVPIIVYHGVRPNYRGQTLEIKRYTVEPETLDREFSYLKQNNYNVIPLESLTKYFEDGTPLPTKPIILTFDDGWKNQYTYAFPLLKKYGFTATFFIFTSAIEHNNFMTWDEIRELDKAGMTIGGHTRTHPYLTKIVNPAELEKEISGGKKRIEEKIGHKIVTFAYPFGLYNKETIVAVREAGYKIARTSSPGIWHEQKNLLETTAIYDHNSSILFTEFVRSAKNIGQFFEKK